MVLLHPIIALEAWANLTNIQWWFAFFIFLCGLDMLHDRKSILPSYPITVILMMIAFSTPAGLFVILLFGIKLIIMARYRTLGQRDKSKFIAMLSIHDFIKLMLILIPCIIQVLTILDSPRYVGSLLVLPEKIFLGTFSFFRSTGWFLLYEWVWLSENVLFSAIDISLAASIVQAITGALLWLLLLVFSYKSGAVQFNTAIYMFSFSFAFWAFCFVAMSVDLLESVAFHGESVSRYFHHMFLIVALLIMIVIIKLLKIDNKCIKKIAICLLAIFCLMPFVRFRMPGNAQEATIFWRDYSRYFVASSDQRVRIPISYRSNFNRWFVEMPIYFDGIREDESAPAFFILSENANEIEDSYYEITIEDVDTEIYVFFQPTNGQHFKNAVVGAGSTFYPAMISEFDENDNLLCSS